MRNLLLGILDSLPREKVLTLPHWLAVRYLGVIVTPYTITDRVRLRSLYRLGRLVDENNIPGDIIECGVRQGGTAAILAHLCSRSKLPRKCWLFDSFEGMPVPTEHDLPSRLNTTAESFAGKERGDIETVQEVLKLVGADLSKVEIVPGWFDATFPTVNIPQIALLNVDADWYESVKLCLEKFYDSVQLGGYISFDDYAHWPGCRKAVDEFRVARGIQDPMQAAGDAGWFQKTKM